MCTGEAIDRGRFTSSLMFLLREYANKGLSLNKWPKSGSVCKSSHRLKMTFLICRLCNENLETIVTRVCSTFGRDEKRSDLGRCYTLLNANPTTCEE